MNCPKCGEYNPIGTVICGNCGSSMSAHSEDMLGDAVSLFVRGQMYGSNKEYNKALSYFLKSAEMGYSGAYREIGDIYYYGYGVTVDYFEAAKWYQKAVDEYEAFGSTYENLAVMYRYGKGVAEDFNKSLRFYRLAIEFYKTPSLFSDTISLESAEALGSLYESAPDGIRSFNLSIQYYEQAAELDSENPTIYTKLGMAYGKGIGRPINYEKAFRFYKKAVEYGCEDGEVYFNLAELYQNGKGGDTNEYYARDYYKKAITLGYKQAEASLEELLQRMQKEREERQAALAQLQARLAESEANRPSEQEEWRRRLTRTCPRCGRNSGHPIGEFEKKASIGFWGFASRMWGKSYKCDVCDYRW